VPIDARTQPPLELALWTAAGRPCLYRRETAGEQPPARADDGADPGRGAGGGLAIVRLQDNYVAQWGGADATHPVPDNMRTQTPEFTAPLDASSFTTLPDRDGYAPQVGFVDSFPAARDPAAGRRAHPA
jgi:hypothetical protein